jgi:D-arabinose 1-dehydrogenase-like Zn-dependent alcohol dehydrogenase
VADVIDGIIDRRAGKRGAPKGSFRRWEMNDMYTTKAYAAQSENSWLGLFSFQRRDPLPRDVQIDILYCGVCHSDLHQARNEWHNTIYPCVPGHEIVGRVVKVGSEVKNMASLKQEEGGR